VEAAQKLARLWALAGPLLRLSKKYFSSRTSNIIRLRTFDQRRFVKPTRKNILLATIAYSGMERSSLAYVSKPSEIVDFCTSEELGEERDGVRGM
jgi:hypothetical protein